MVPSVHIFVSVLYILKEITGIECQEFENPEIARHLNMGRDLLTQGLYDDALSHYHAAVEADPYNYLTYYTRATVYMAIGKIASAIKDLTKVIELKPDFAAARLQRGNILLKQGKLDEAHIDYEMVLRTDPMNQEAHRSYSIIDPIKRDIETAYIMVADHNYQAAVDLLTQLLQDVPWDTKLREMRSECYEAIGDMMNAISDLRSILKSQANSQLRYLKLSQLYYEIGETEESLNAIRECLRFDPDHKGCFTHYKYVKKIAAQLKAIQTLTNEGNFDECVTKAESAISLETKVPQIMYLLRAKHCKCLNKAKRSMEAITACTAALKIMPDDVDVLCERGDAHIVNENYEDAVSDFQRASTINEHSQRAHDGVKRALKLEKQAKKKNYYAILGVKRTAGKREILKAYRKLAQKWHPDNFQGDEKATAEKKFIDIAAAKEVLSDPEKRQKFDNGEDPLDPESQQGGFNPFQQVALLDFEGKAVNHEMYETIKSASEEGNDIDIVYGALYALLKCALSIPEASLKQEVFKEDLKELKIQEDYIDDLANFVYGQKRQSIVSSLQHNVPHLPKLSEFRWRVDVAISTSTLNRVLEPAIIIEIKLSDGRKETFEVHPSQFHRLRFAVATLLKEMENLETRNILKN
ncbi:hypothetical protein JTE90_006387 [Oedothorax gibbosus]|uniref:Uncharacterized protein n=1 Tax=Oedothorax gibbosus TaxID=931172 RepID=A0AAV6VYM4_9ARAC|nr:hypothetical protein JTE90_006387 [Oedothorax gibbosus]